MDLQCFGLPFDLAVCIVTAVVHRPGGVFEPNIAGAFWSFGGALYGGRVSRHVIVLRTTDECQVRGKHCQRTSSGFDVVRIARIWFVVRSAVVWCVRVSFCFC